MCPCDYRFVSGSCLDPSCKFVFDPEEPSTAVFDLTPVCLEAQNADFTHNDVLGFAYFAQVRPLSPWLPLVVVCFVVPVWTARFA
jgi:hypothetical protein